MILHPSASRVTVTERPSLLDEADALAEDRGSLEDALELREDEAETWVDDRPDPDDVAEADAPAP
ncbi:hypothetical protein A0J57_11005 [Sphingobium sp. 22B]|jgi:hypothetical protein|uniref:hypothetical protein n=1 Tax=unclassified Sphingobium TaxID=2611147 RepID=UPI000783513C|nr:MULTISPECIES: hypothetical protein [unclassified Sphingobium]KXU32295.1 hypothetical protein AXW74_07600 [Sphingobium sp. AM]KYC32187.1 hypothetical protein A0J57_11005 [Sphingobium sp. 22B]OAP31819.1 hypothetical protein A8O16_10805 [Sphingobium sp. 20006FA]